MFNLPKNKKIQSNLLNFIKLFKEISNYKELMGTNIYLQIIAIYYKTRKATAIRCGLNYYKLIMFLK